MAENGHARDQIREAIRTRFANIPGLYDHIVVDEEKMNLTEDEAPWAFVQLTDEQVNLRTLDGKKDRTATLFVDLIGGNRFNVKQQLETLAARIEDATDQDETFDRKVRATRLQGLTYQESEDTKHVRLRLTFELTYSTAAGNAATPI